MKQETRIHVRQHRKTKLLMALSDDLPGFVVHAHSEEELLSKLAPAFESFMRGIGGPVDEVEVVQESSSDFWPPEYIARASRAEAAYI